MRLPIVISGLFSDISLYLHALTAEEYARPLDMLSRASIGKHTRHSLECFQCLFQQAPRGEVNYDERARDHALESDPAYALSVLKGLSAQVGGVELHHPLELKGDLQTDANGQGERIQTTYGRELVYNIEHCIHHLAIIRIALHLIRSELELPASFGVAPSTLTYWEQNHQASQAS